MLVKNKRNLLQELYVIEIFKGLMITMKNMLFAKKVTIQYPEERRN